MSIDHDQSRHHFAACAQRAFPRFAGGAAAGSARSGRARTPPRPRWPRRFSTELAEVQGEVIRSATMEEARRTTGGIGRQAQWTTLGMMDRPHGPRSRGPICRRALAAWAAADWQPQHMAELSASVIEADVLLADTGSCLIACPTAQDRLLCYLPPACVVVARVEQLAEHLPAAWAGDCPRVADPAQRGEFVIVTGPSRTADIEKILILGVHGPKRLVVLLIG